MTREDFLAIAGSRYDEMNKLNEIKDFHTYEQEFERIWIDLAREMLEKNISQTGSDRRKKTKFGRASGVSK